LNSDEECTIGPTKWAFFERNNAHKLRFPSSRNKNTPVIVYKDDHGWTTAVFDVTQCGMTVQQVKGGKHGAVAVENPYPTSWFPDT